MPDRSPLVFFALVVAVVIVIVGDGAEHVRARAMLASSDVELQLAADLIDARIHAELRDGQLLSLAMAQDSFVKTWIESGEADVAAMSEYLTQKVALADAFTAFLVVDSTRNYYATGGFLKQVSEADPDDDWFFSVRANEPDIEFNIDPDAASDDQLTIFFNERMLDDTGAFIASVGLGIRLNTLEDMVKSYRARYRHNLYFIAMNGAVLYFENDVRPGAYARIARKLGIGQGVSQHHQSLRYEDNGRQYALESRLIKELNLVLVVEAPLS
ncbi:MAG: cache domain-containing protein [Pseudomonadota bacterium]